MPAEAPEIATGALSDADGGTPRAPRRNAEATRERILAAARKEFARYGYDGGRVERICRGAKSNIRMLYHYFGSKETLYLEVFEETYRSIRTLEQRLDVDSRPPAEAMTELVSLTFDFLSKDKYFVRMMMNENLLMGKTARKSARIPEMTRPLVSTLDRMLRRGQEDGSFRHDVEALDLYVTILGLCFIQVSNRHTLSHMLQIDLGDPAWLARRKGIVIDVVMRYLAADGSGSRP